MNSFFLEPKKYKLFGISEKGTKFEKNLPLLICRYLVASIKSGIFFQTLYPSQKVQTLHLGNSNNHKIRQVEKSEHSINW